jgi:hypothetical protein
MCVYGLEPNSCNGATPKKQQLNWMKKKVQKKNDFMVFFLRIFALPFALSSLYEGLL